MIYNAEGFLQKMSARLDGKQVQYFLDLEPQVAMNELVGKSIRLTFTGQMACVGCGRAISKTFQQGYCFPCFKNKAACDICIIKPELCHFDQGTCREPEWGQAHCMQKHVVYLANTSGLKVGVTRFVNVPQRFIDQGAVAALPVFEVESRYQAGLLEVELAKLMADKTNWRQMLKGIIKPIDLFAEAKGLVLDHPRSSIGLIELEYPVLQYPEKIVSLNFDKNPIVEGVLNGIKGQYLLLSTGVINLRNFSGYQVQLSA